jgi:hypothetical protein
MEVQNYCRACPVCKAGVETDKVATPARVRLAIAAPRCAAPHAASARAGHPHLRQGQRLRVAAPGSGQGAAGAAPARGPATRYRAGGRAAWVAGPPRAAPPVAALLLMSLPSAGERGPQQPDGRAAGHLRLPAGARWGTARGASRGPSALRRARLNIHRARCCRPGLRGGPHPRAAAPGGDGRSFAPRPTIAARTGTGSPDSRPHHTFLSSPSRPAPPPPLRRRSCPGSC